MTATVRLLLLLLPLSLSLCTSFSLRHAPEPKIECSKRSTRNHWRESHSAGCMKETTVEYNKWRQKCRNVANDAANRAGRLVVDMADSEERRVSDELLAAADIKLNKRLADIKRRTDDKIDSLETGQCLPERQQMSPPIPTDDCVDAETVKLQDQAEIESNQARTMYDKDMDRAVKIAENKKTQILVDAENQKQEARMLVLSNCAEYLKR